MSPIEGFDMIKAAYTKKHKEAVRSGDEATAARVGFNSLSLKIFGCNHLMNDILMVT